MITWIEALAWLIAGCVATGIGTHAIMRGALKKARANGYEDGFLAGRNVTRNELRQKVEALAYRESIAPVCELCDDRKLIVGRSPLTGFPVKLHACPVCCPEEELYVGAVEIGPEIFRQDGREVVR